MWSVPLEVLAEVGAIVQQMERRFVHQPAETTSHGLILVEARLVSSERTVACQKPEGLFPSDVLHLLLIERSFISFALEAFSLSGQVRSSDLSLLFLVDSSALRLAGDLVVDFEHTYQV